MTTATTAMIQPQLAPRFTWSLRYRERGLLLPTLLAVPTLISAMSYVAGGVPTLTDLAFILLTLACLLGVGNELAHFSRRFGLGGLILYGGVLTWFCDDYMSNWFRFDFAANPATFSAYTIAKAACMHCTFIMMMSLGILIPWTKWPVKFLQCVPEPTSKSFYFILVLLLFAIGMLPYVLFTQQGLFTALYQDMFGGRVGGAKWTVGRTGLINYSWGGYSHELIKMGRFGAVLAVFYAVLVTKQRWQQAICWGIWGVWLMLGFGSGTRGLVLFVTMPAIFVFFLKHHAQTAMQGKRFSKQAYIWFFVFAIITLSLVQLQGSHRNETFYNVSIADVDLTEIQGNSMFSEGLTGYEMIPEQQPFFHNSFPGEGLIRPIPQTLFLMAVHPIPRALWHNKPIDPVWAWFNDVMAGSTVQSGTTVSKGIVGWWYFRYGLLGVIQGGLFMGFMMRIAERSVQLAYGRPMVILIGLTLLTWIFRCYRDLGMPELWEVGVSVIVLFVLVKIERLLRGSVAM